MARETKKILSEILKTDKNIIDTLHWRHRENRFMIMNDEYCIKHILHETMEFILHKEEPFFFMDLYDCQVGNVLWKYITFSERMDFYKCLDRFKKFGEFLESLHTVCCGSRYDEWDQYGQQSFLSVMERSIIPACQTFYEEPVYTTTGGAQNFPQPVFISQNEVDAELKKEILKVLESMRSTNLIFPNQTRECMFFIIDCLHLYYNATSKSPVQRISFSQFVLNSTKDRQVQTFETHEDLKWFLEQRFIPMLTYMEKISEFYYSHTSELESLCSRVIIPVCNAELERKPGVHNTTYVCNIR